MSDTRKRAEEWLSWLRREYSQSRRREIEVIADLLTELTGYEEAMTRGNILAEEKAARIAALEEENKRLLGVVEKVREECGFYNKDDSEYAMARFVLSLLPSEEVKP